MNRFIRCLAWAGLAALAACNTSPVPVTPTAPMQPGVASAKPTLADEQRRLAELFRGTPVVFSMQADSAMRVDVPLAFCFDAGRAIVKPPLAAVLDRLARSQLNETTHLGVSAPVDVGAKNQALGVQRAVAVRKYMVERGIAEARFLAVSVSVDGTLKVVVSPVPRP